MSTRGHTTYREVFASRGYPALFGASTLAVLASTLQILAFTVLVFAESRSPALSSAAFAAGFLPSVLGGLLLPSLADRLPAKALIAVGGVVRAASCLLLASDSLGLAGGFVVITAAGAIQPLFQSAQSGLVSRLLDGDRYVLGRSLFTVTSMVSQLVGLAVGGVLLQTVGPAAALLGAAAMQLLGALLALIGLPPTPVAQRDAVRWHVAETIAGYRDLMRIPLVRALLLLWWTPLSLSVGAEALAVAYAGEAHADGLLTAALIGAAPAGALVGSVLVGRLCTPPTRERLVLPLLVLLGAGLLPLGFTPPPVVAVGLLTLANVGLAYELGGQAEFRAALPPGREALGFGLLGLGSMSGQGLGALATGPVAELVGTGPAMAIIGALVLITTAILLPPARRLLQLAHSRVRSAAASSSASSGPS